MLLMIVIGSKNPDRNIPILVTSVYLLCKQKFWCFSPLNTRTRDSLDLCSCIYAERAAGAQSGVETELMGLRWSRVSAKRGHKQSGSRTIGIFWTRTRQPVLCTSASIIDVARAHESANVAIAKRETVASLSLFLITFVIVVSQNAACLFMGFLPEQKGKRGKQRAFETIQFSRFTTALLSH